MFPVCFSPAAHFDLWMCSYVEHYLRVQLLNRAESLFFNMVHRHLCGHRYWSCREMSWHWNSSRDQCMSRMQSSEISQQWQLNLSLHGVLNAAEWFILNEINHINFLNYFCWALCSSAAVESFFTDTKARIWQVIVERGAFIFSLSMHFIGRRVAFGCFLIFGYSWGKMA